MDKDKLNQLLTELHEELGSADTVDASSKELLRQAVDDINQAVGAVVQDDITVPAPHPVREQLEKSAVDFEADHPRLAAILSRIVDTLGQMGI